MNDFGKEAYREYLGSKHWKSLRLKTWELSNKKCECCHDGLLVLKRVNFHHVNYRHWYDCVPSDLMVLCMGCHNTYHMLKDRHPDAADEKLWDMVLQWIGRKPISQSLEDMKRGMDKKKQNRRDRKHEQARQDRNRNRPQHKNPQRQVKQKHLTEKQKRKIEAERKARMEQSRKRHEECRLAVQREEWRREQSVLFGGDGPWRGY